MDDKYEVAETALARPDKIFDKPLSVVTVLLWRLWMKIYELSTILYSRNVYLMTI